MIFSPTYEPFAEPYLGKGWRSKLAKKAAKLAYRDFFWTRNLRALVRAHAATTTGRP